MGVSTVPVMMLRERRHRGRQCRSHDRRRVVAHRVHADPERTRWCYVGATVLPFFGVFGDLSAVLQPDLAQLVKFPRRATNELAELRGEVERMKRMLGTLVSTSGTAQPA